MMREIIVATGNTGKLKEIGEILRDLPLHLTSLRDHWTPVPDIPETGDTFIENAKLKASWVYSRKGIWTLADDSGLEVAALDGAPGVKSARYAGENGNSAKNNAKLLNNLSGVTNRKARFRCVMALQISAEKFIVAEGTCEGNIISEERGNEGFGYDPLFIPDGFDKTFAELDANVKNAISHRGKALNMLKEQLLQSGL